MTYISPFSLSSLGALSPKAFPRPSGVRLFLAVTTAALAALYCYKRPPQFLTSLLGRIGFGQTGSSEAPRQPASKGASHTSAPKRATHPSTAKAAASAACPVGAPPKAAATAAAAAAAFPKPPQPGVAAATTKRQFLRPRGNPRSSRGRGTGVIFRKGAPPKQVRRGPPQPRSPAQAFNLLMNNPTLLDNLAACIFSKIPRLQSIVSTLGVTRSSYNDYSLAETLLQSISHKDLRIKGLLRNLPMVKDSSVLQTFVKKWPQDASALEELSLMLNVLGQKPSDETQTPLQQGLALLEAITLEKTGAIQSTIREDETPIEGLFELGGEPTKDSLTDAAYAFQCLGKQNPQQIIETIQGFGPLQTESLRFLIAHYLPEELQPASKVVRALMVLSEVLKEADLTASEVIEALSNDQEGCREFLLTAIDLMRTCPLEHLHYSSSETDPHKVEYHDLLRIHYYRTIHAKRYLSGALLFAAKDLSNFKGYYKSTPSDLPSAVKAGLYAAQISRILDKGLERAGLLESCQMHVKIDPSKRGILVFLGPGGDYSFQPEKRVDAEKAPFRQFALLEPKMTLVKADGTSVEVTFTEEEKGHIATSAQSLIYDDKTPFTFGDYTINNPKPAEAHAGPAAAAAAAPSS